MYDLICRATNTGNSVGFTTEMVKDGKIIGRAESDVQSLANLINSDKSYGLLKPKNGKYFTYKIMSLDKEITDSQMIKATSRALNRWAFKLKLKYSKADSGEEVDIKIYFRSEEEDPLLTSSTIAYMYYPLGSTYNGIMVINTRYYFTLSGNAVNMHYIDPVHYPDPKTAPIQGASIDLDVVMYHEFGHGILGLQHDVHAGNGMAYRYDLMSEMPSTRDLSRGAAKIGYRDDNKSYLERLWNYLTKTQDRD